MTTTSDRDRRILHSFAEGRTAEGIGIHFDINAREVMAIVRRACTAQLNATVPGRQPATGDVVTSQDLLDTMLKVAGASSSARTRRQGEKLQAAVSALAAVLAEEKAVAARAAAETAARREAEERLEKARRELTEAQAALQQVAGKTRRASTPKTATSTVRSIAAVPAGMDREARAWAIANGVPVSPRGRVSRDVVDAYLAAQNADAA